MIGIPSELCPVNSAQSTSQTGIINPQSPFPLNYTPPVDLLDNTTNVDYEHHHHHSVPDGVTAGGAGYLAYPSVYGDLDDSYTSHQHQHQHQHQRFHDPEDDSPEDLFPDMPSAKKRKFILVEDNVRGSRMRVRVTLEGVNTREIPDSFRRGTSVFPRSFFPREMQSEPPSPTGGKFFGEDREDEDKENNILGKAIAVASPWSRAALNSSMGGSRGRKRAMTVQVEPSSGIGMEVAVPRMKRSTRGKEIRLNDLAYRMAWLQSRVFAGRTVFLQRALDCYRNKTRAALDSMMMDAHKVAPHYETRVGKRRWADYMRRVGDAKEDD